MVLLFYRKEKEVAVLKNKSRLIQILGKGSCIAAAGILLISQCCMPVYAAPKKAAKNAAKSTAKNVVVCIDPGHGGSNHGAMYNGYEEKNLTLQIAQAMQQELSLYQGVTVVMTRTADTDVSLTDRAKTAADAKADFLYSIHLNASADHNLFGSEVWVSGYGQQYADGMSFGSIELNELSSDIGVYTKAVKTKISESGSNDYYSIINNGRKYGIPTAIIEHCYMDEPHDTAYFTTPQALTALGKADATAVAKYFKLKSQKLGTDYSTFQKPAYAVPAAVQSQDTTPPDVSQISLNSYNASTRQVSLHVRANDAQSRIIYYNYSCDGGATWSRLCGWTANGEGDVQFTLPAASNGSVCVNVWNAYELYTQSNVLKVY